jgi:hypothetical protein
MRAFIYALRELANSGIGLPEIGFSTCKVRSFAAPAIQPPPAIEPFDPLTTRFWNCNPTPKRPSGSR